MKSHLLFLSHRIPYPPDKGDKIRSYNILRHLARDHRVHLGTFIDDPDDWRHVNVLRELCEDTYFAKLDPRWAKLRCLSGFLTGEPLNLPYFRDSGLAAWVGDVLRRVRPDVLFGYSSAIGQYMMDPAPRPRRIVMDFMDVDSDKWRQYAETQPWPLSWVYGRESRTLRAFDRRLAGLADASTVVSDKEAELFRHLIPESAKKIFGVSNGIDSDFFSPERDYPPVIDGPGPNLVFTGVMDYWPNVDAVSWFAADILPRVRERFAAARLVVVGSNPAPKVVALGKLDGVHVTGRVADVRPYLAQAAAAVVPIRVARGIQNKVLEAMAMARPVVTTPQALEGIEASPETEVYLAADAPAFAATTIRAIEDPDAPKVGAAGRRRVVESFAWAARLSAYDKLISGA